MKTPSNRIHKLLLKYRINQCTRKEYEELIQLCQQSGNELVIKEIMRKDWEGEQLEVPLEPQISPQSQRLRWIPFLKVAAAIVLLITAGFLLFQWYLPDAVTYVTGNGVVMEITLPDGSEVTLNANSNLTWVPAEEKENDRIVTLTGEAFFHVVKEKVSNHDRETYRGFQVNTPKMTVHVLGTAFNVSARAENTEVFLEEGSVELEISEQIKPVHKMVPGDKVILDNKTEKFIEKKTEQVATSASWITGILNYHDKSMEDVLQNLSELFGVEISCEDPVLKTKKINLGVPYMDWENTRRALEMAIEVEFRKVENHYTVIQTDKQNTNQKK